MSRRLDWILPAYNPTIGWDVYAIRRLGEILYHFPQWEVHLYVVTDGSTRGHEKEVRSRLLTAMQGRLTYVDYPTNQGKGYALRSAVELCSSEYILYTDWDFPFTNESYIDALRAIETGANLILPQRSRDEYLARLSPMRRFLSQGSYWINKIFLALPANDTQGGIKLFDQKARSCFLATTIRRFLFDSEFVARCTKAGLNIRTTPCHIRPEIELSGMGLRTLRSELPNIFRVIYARWFC